MENFIVSARKYRPATFETVVGQDSITNTLKSAIKNNHLAHAYLFCGPRGVGKTTCARIFAKTINCSNIRNNSEACDECESCISFNTMRSFNIHELDAASNNKVEDIRSLNDQVRIPPQIGKYSIYIIDEVHMLSSSAFNAFLKTLEEPPAHAIFILATTEKHKIIPTILSRCQIFDFNRIRVEDIVNRLMFVAKKESVDAGEEALHVIAQKADGALRDALSIFDQIVSLSGKTVSYNDVIQNLNVLDYEYYFKTIDGLVRSDISTVLMIFNEVLEKGFDGHNFISGLNSHMRDLLVSKDESTLRLLETTPSVRKRYQEQTGKCPVDFLFAALEAGAVCDLNYKGSKNPRLHVELTLIRMCRLNGELAGNAEKKKSDPVQLKKAEEEFTNPVSTESEAKIVRAEEKKSYDVDNSPGKERGNDTAKPAASHIPVIEKPLKTFSIKDLISGETRPKDKPHNPEGMPPDSSQGTDRMEFSVENFMSSWKDFTETVSRDGTRVVSMFNTIVPEVENNSTITLHLSNSALKDLFIQDYKPKLLIFLERRFNMAGIEVETVVDQSEPENLLYSDDQKYCYLAAKYPSLRDMKKTFNLDIT